MASPPLHTSGPQLRWLLVVILVLSSGPIGCASRSVEEIVADRARVLGTWTYRTDGISALQRGTIQISMHDGKLVGRIQDTWRGTLDAHVYLRGAHMELALDRVRISGELVHGRFRGSVHQPVWDAARGDPWRGSTGYFVAHRVRSTSAMDDLSVFGCTPLLRESSYACSPFGRP